MSGNASRRGMSAGQARTLEFVIVGLSILALVLIFQPFALDLFTAGAAAIIIVGLLFNLVPFCTPGRTGRSLLKITVLIVIIFAIVTALSLSAAELYASYISPAAD